MRTEEEVESHLKFLENEYEQECNDLYYIDNCRTNLIKACIETVKWVLENEN